MKRSGVWSWIACVALAASTLVAAEPPVASATATPTAAEVTLLKALAANPVTAPYAIGTQLRGGRVVLIGRVGTKMAHDVAVRTAIAQGIRFDDSLVIDTTAPVRLANPGPGAVAGIGPGAGASPYPGPMVGPFGGFGQMTNTFPYPASTYGLAAAGPGLLYPPSLYGRYDDPFWGFEPPVVSYPPWWGAMSAQRLAGDQPVRGGAPQNGPAQAPAGVVVGGGGDGQPAAAGNGATADLELSPSGKPGSVIMDVDPSGTATISGEVQSAADRQAVALKVSQLAGITQVVNNLAIRDQDAAPVAPARADDTPPPLPMPPIDPPTAPVPVRNDRAIPVDAPAVAGLVSQPAGRLPQALAKRPALAGLPIQVSLRDGVAYLTGKVPSAYEAMLAFRAAQREPGVREVDDRLQFPVPDGERANPLVKKGRPEDLEPYLEAQIRRQVGDQAHLDRVRVQGDRLEIRGTIAEVGDRARVEAVLRSMPLLRGFQLEPEFQVD